MQTDFVFTIETVLWAVFLFALLLILGKGILPLLKTLQSLSQEKEAELRAVITSLDNQLAEVRTVPKTIAHDVAAGLEFHSTQPAIIYTTQVLTEGLRVLHKLLPDTPETVPSEVVAEKANEVAEFIVRLTDNIPGNALSSDINKASG